MSDLLQQVEAVMHENRRSKDGFVYTIPSPDIYPFQWLWDSCFHAIILSKFDQKAAKAELRSLLSRPLPWGLFPHILYWEKNKHLGKWGREMRGDVISMAWGVEGTSAITQPPLVARALWELFTADRDVNFLKELYPVVRTHYTYLLRERTFGNDSLLYLINPDESGEDNSPRFDATQELPSMHTANENLEKRITRMLQNARCRFDARICMRSHFAVADVSFNIIFAESLGCLAAIADILGHKQDKSYFDEQKRQSELAIRGQLHVENGEFYSYDDHTKTHIDVKTWNLFMPLYGGLVTDDEAKHLVEDLLLNKKEFWTKYPVPSTAKSEPSFDAEDGFWRGPVWMASNWFIYKGLRRYGYDDVAEQIAEKTKSLIKKSGFREQYSPITGEGIGAEHFTWGGLVLDMK